jgi:hypothetical protein
MNVFSGLDDAGAGRIVLEVILHQFHILLVVVVAGEAPEEAFNSSFLAGPPAGRIVVY